MNICVFSSSSNGIGDCYIHDAVELATLIAKNKMTLVNGGANVGLMEVVSATAVKHGAKTIGVIPEKMTHRNLVSDKMHEVIISKDMQERKARMRELSDAYIALPGGFGTLEEILEVITLKQLDYLNAPVVFINTNGFFDDLFRQFERSYHENFAKENYRKIYFVAKTPHEAINYIINYKPENLGTKWHEVPIRHQSGRVK
ncbi:MAG: TIGR00730 family Rossman fold protein [Prolixibacteraceae bacterium]|jgi:uncharacterized protein (TIGR00730 family)|nr:TIGR00730 family Rossman fold protein [Prolixibacteraceae bacterium]